MIPSSLISCCWWLHFLFGPFWSDATSSLYCIPYDVTGFTLYKREESSVWDEIPAGQDVRSYIFRDLNCGTKYQIYMTAHNEAGAGLPSNTIATRTHGTGSSDDCYCYFLSSRFMETDHEDDINDPILDCNTVNYHQYSSSSSGSSSLFRTFQTLFFLLPCLVLCCSLRLLSECILFVLLFYHFSFILRVLFFFLLTILLILILAPVRDPSNNHRDEGKTGFSLFCSPQLALHSLSSVISVLRSRLVRGSGRKRKIEMGRRRERATHTFFSWVNQPILSSESRLLVLGDRCRFSSFIPAAAANVLPHVYYLLLESFKVTWFRFSESSLQSWISIISVAISLSLSSSLTPYSPSLAVRMIQRQRWWWSLGQIVLIKNLCGGFGCYQRVILSSLYSELLSYDEADGRIFHPPLWRWSSWRRWPL